MKEETKKSPLKKILALLAIFSLVAAFFFGLTHRGSDALGILEESFPSGTSFEKKRTNPLLFEAYGEDGRLLDYVVIEEGIGYGGPLYVATVIDPSGTMEKAIVVDNKETPSWFRKVKEYGFFAQFSGKEISAPISLGLDVDSVTGATVSSKAFSNAIRGGSHFVGKKILDIEVAKQEVKWNFGTNEIALLVLFALVLLGATLKISKLRYITLAAGCFFLGFYMNAPISITNLSSILLGYLKPVKEDPFWWMLVVGTLVITFALGKNLYCHWMCPFGALQEFTTKISGINIKLNRNLMKYAKHTALFLTWLALMIILVTSNGPFGAYEPFGAIFGLSGIGTQWFILPIVLLGSFVISKFWCRLFCPVGVVLDLTFKARRKLSRLFGKEKKEAVLPHPGTRGGKACPSAARGCACSVSTRGESS